MALTYRGIKCVAQFVAFSSQRAIELWSDAMQLGPTFDAIYNQSTSLVPQIDQDLVVNETIYHDMKHSLYDPTDMLGVRWI
eukprot:75187-Amphidinium_carterae.1